MVVKETIYSYFSSCINIISFVNRFQFITFIDLMIIKCYFFAFSTHIPNNEQILYPINTKQYTIRSRITVNYLCIIRRDRIASCEQGIKCLSEVVKSNDYVYNITIVSVSTLNLTTPLQAQLLMTSNIT